MVRNGIRISKIIIYFHKQTWGKIWQKRYTPCIAKIKPAEKLVTSRGKLKKKGYQKYIDLKKMKCLEI